MRRSDSRDPRTIRESLVQLGVEDIKPLVALIGAKKQGRKVSAERAVLCEWNVCLTNLPTELLTSKVRNGAAWCTATRLSG